MELDRVLASYRRNYPPILNTAQVAEMLGVEVGHVRIQVQRNGLPAYRWGHKYRFFRDDVIGWLRDQAVDPSAGLADTPTSTVSVRRL